MKNPTECSFRIFSGKLRVRPYSCFFPSLSMDNFPVSWSDVHSLIQKRTTKILHRYQWEFRTKNSSCEHTIVHRTILFIATKKRQPPLVPEAQFLYIRDLQKPRLLHGNPGKGMRTDAWSRK